MAEPTSVTATSDDPPFEELRAAMQVHLDRLVQGAASGNPRLDGRTGHLFITSPAELWPLFLGALPAAWRKPYDCAACRRFVERYGAVVWIDEGGNTWPAVWPATLGRGPRTPLDSAVRVMRDEVLAAPVVGVFFGKGTWGTAVAGAQPDGKPWTHLAVNVPETVAGITEPPEVHSPHQLAAKKRHGHELLTRALERYPRHLIEQAVALLAAGSLYRSEIAASIASWLLARHDELREIKNQRLRTNLLWRAVAAAPDAYPHVTSSMLGFLMDDIRDGRSFAELSARWTALAGPLMYQRPQAAPDAGNVAEAERLFAKLGLGPALRRRFARLEDLALLWQPRAPRAAAAPRTGIFADVRTKDAPAGPARGGVTAPPVTMTFAKFVRTVLPTADHIEHLVAGGLQPFAAFITAADPAAPPIVQWDQSEHRNPVTSYTYVKGSEAEHWGLVAGAWVRVTAISLAPYMWPIGREGAGALQAGIEVVRFMWRHHAPFALLILDGAKDLHHKAGGGLFPEYLREELRPVRATIEAHVKAALIEGQEDATACGLALNSSQVACLLRVTDGRGIVTTFNLDRWE